jgi:hypothetical protein
MRVMHIWVSAIIDPSASTIIEIFSSLTTKPQGRFTVHKHVLQLASVVPCMIGIRYVIIYAAVHADKWSINLTP